MFACEYVERCADHETPGSTADPGVQSDRGLLLHCLPARFGIAFIQLAAKQGLEMCHFQFFDQVFVLSDGAANAGQLHDRDDHFVDYAVEMRRHCGPDRGQKGSRLVVDPIEREASLKGRN